MKETMRSQALNSFRAKWLAHAQQMNVETRPKITEMTHEARGQKTRTRNAWDSTSLWNTIC